MLVNSDAAKVLETRENFMEGADELELQSSLYWGRMGCSSCFLLSPESLLLTDQKLISQGIVLHQIYSPLNPPHSWPCHNHRVEAKHASAMLYVEVCGAKAGLHRQGEEVALVGDVPQQENTLWSFNQNLFSLSSCQGAPVPA